MIKSKNILLFISFFFLINAFSQIKDKSSAIWYFGDSAGVDFRSCEPVFLENSAMPYQIEGCTSISTDEGDLLFYSNGDKVWNSNHQIMPNGVLANYFDNAITTTQGVIAIKQPKKKEIYYLFSIVNGELSYSVIDMTLDNNLGDVVYNTTFEIPYFSLTEKLAAVHHSNGTDIWVSVHQSDSDAFYSYLFTENGVVQTPIISVVGSMYNDYNSIGHLKFSPDGTKAACAKFQDGDIEIFEFNPSTGIFSNPVLINPIFENKTTYGIEFSPDGTKLYVVFSNFISNYGDELFQFDLTDYSQSAIQNSAYKISESLNGLTNFGALQLAINGKIYITQTPISGIYSSNIHYLSAINKPNKSQLQCDYVDSSIYLGDGFGIYGFPNIVASLLKSVDFEVGVNTGCIEEETKFILDDTHVEYNSLSWDFGFYEAFSTLLNPTFVYNDTGVFYVQLTIIDSCKEYTIGKNICIKDRPNFTLPVDSVFCLGDSVYITPSFSSYYSNDTLYNWNDSSKAPYLVSIESGEYTLTIGKGNCTQMESIHLDFVDCSVDFSIPNIITPNNDGLNEYFSFQGVEEYLYQLVIFNKWGKELFRDDFYQGDWKGGELKDGNYYYKVKSLKDDSLYNGWVQITR